MKIRIGQVRKVFALLLVCVLALSACGAKENSIESNLEEDDFYVWQDGKVVYAASDFADEDFYFNDTALFDANLISTKRGIQIGNDATAVADAYAGGACSIYYADMSDEEYDKYSNIPSYAEVMDEFAALPEYWVIYEMWIVSGEVTFDNQGVLTSINDKPLDTYDECEWYQLSFIIVDGRVNNIGLSMMDFVNTEIF